MTPFRRVFPLLLLAAILSSAGGAQRARAEYREISVENGGKIAGTILTAGDVPILPPLPVFKQQEICGGNVVDFRLVVGPGDGLANAVVYLVDVPAGKPILRDHAVLLDNAKCAFIPHVRSGSVGQTLEIHNSDPFVHDAHAWLGTRTLFNDGILPGHTAHEPLSDAGLIHINCNVRHTWMQAYVYVGDNPYNAVTGPDGRYVIDGIPPGTYTVRVWHELLGNIDRSVTVESGKTTTVDAALPIVAPVPPAQAP